MTQHDLDRIKNTQLQIMDSIHRFCTENDIVYYIIGGTLLGAVRHKGFIPWDIDIDIAMQRQDYEKFKCLWMSRMNEQYRYYDHTMTKNYWRPHAIVFDTNTRIHIKNDSNNKNVDKTGVYIDIFPLDNAPDNEKLRDKQTKKLIKIRKFKAYRIPYSYSKKKIKIFAHRCVSLILSMIASVPFINRLQQQEMSRYNGSHTECLCSMASQYSYKKQCMPRDIYGKPVLLMFEGREYYAPEKYVEYLTRIYGNYMELPPIEKRQANLEIYSKIEYLSE